MSILVSFPIEAYKKYAADAFAGFTPKADFSLENAKALMWFTQLAYEYDEDKAEKIKLMESLWQFTKITPFEVKEKHRYDTHGIIGERDDAVLLAFCGTDPLVIETVLTDFRPKRNSDDIHEGFAEAAGAEGVKDRVTEAVNLSREKGRSLLISGHSLGAAIACLAARQARDKNCPPKAVYTYGMPRTGGATFKADYDTSLGKVTYRLANGPDLVATVPLRRMGYHHVGRLLWCGTGKDFDPADLVATMDSDKPGFAGSLLRTIVKRLSCLVRLKLACLPQGPGPLGRTFKYLPLNIREHLQDRYLNALGAKIDFEKLAKAGTGQTSPASAAAAAVRLGAGAA
jgi:triacylglycerol lipase